MALTRLSLLVRLRRDGDVTGWDEFHAVYRPFLLRFLRSRGLSDSDAHDVVQEVFLKLLRMLRDFEFDPHRARFRTWLQRVALNSLIDWRRRQSRRGSCSLRQEQLEQVPTSRADFDWEAEHRCEVVRHALNQVRLQSRPLTWRCFERHVLDSLPAEAVAAETGLTVNGVYINAARTLDRLRLKCRQFDQELAHDGE